jgi:hypothetical protein
MLSDLFPATVQFIACRLRLVADYALSFGFPGVSFSESCSFWSRKVFACVPFSLSSSCSRVRRWSSLRLSPSSRLRCCACRSELQCRGSLPFLSETDPICAFFLVLAEQHRLVMEARRGRGGCSGGRGGLAARSRSAGSRQRARCGRGRACGGHGAGGGTGGSVRRRRSCRGRRCAGPGGRRRGGGGEREEVERRQRGYGGGELAGDAAGDEGRGGGRRSAGTCRASIWDGRYLQKKKNSHKRKSCGGVKL